MPFFCLSWTAVKRVLIAISFALLIEVIAYADIEVHFLDVGQGDSAIVLCDGKAMMIDGGDQKNSQLIYSYLRNTLKISHLDYIVSTHPHSDHAGGLAAALNACTVDTIFSPVFYYDDPGFLAFRKQAQLHNKWFSSPIPGNTVELGNAKILFIAPESLTANMNNNSIVLKISYGEISFLFTGDAGQDEELQLLESGFDLDSTVLKVGHHGSDTSTTASFLRAVAPDYAVISCGADNPYGHPSQEVIQRLTNMQASIYRTDQSGTIICQSDGKSIIWKAEKFFETSSICDNNETRSVIPTTNEHSIIYIGNLSSHKFHYADCIGVKNMKEKNKVVFSSREEAISIGYSPCGICNP